MKGEEKMERKRLPNEVKTQVEDIVARFHATEIRDPRCRYVPRYRGRFLYLDREDYGRLHPICRLEYTGRMTTGRSPSTNTVTSGTMTRMVLSG
jgi:hypothetical protein